MGNKCCKSDDKDEEEEMKRQSLKKRQKRVEIRVRRLREVKGESDAAKRIQAWWRGTLVRRTLLAAALRVWIIQLWWLRLLRCRGCGLRRGLLQIYAVEEQGAVRLQSWFRMRQCHRDYCLLRGTVCLSRDPQNCFRFQIQDAPQDPQARRLGGSKDPEFRVEILSV